MKTERFEMRASTAFIQALDNWRRLQPDIPSRAEALRRIVAATESQGTGPSLSALLLQFFQTQPEKIEEFGAGPGDSPADLVAKIMADESQSPAKAAANLAHAFEDEADPTAQQITALLKRVAS